MRVAKRSSAIKVLAILNLVGGFLGLLGSLFAVVGLVSGPNLFGTPPNANSFDPALIEAQMAATLPAYRVAQYGSLVLGFVLDFLLISSGFGLLYYQKWARVLAIAYAVLSLVVKVATVAYQFLVVIPAMGPIIDQALVNAPPAQRQAMAIGGKVGGYLGGCLPLVFAVYPIVVLSILLSKSGKAAFDPLPREDDYDDKDDYDDRRERFGDRPRRDDDRYGERDDRGGRN